jgi:hypothetical protein
VTIPASVKPVMPVKAFQLNNIFFVFIEKSMQAISSKLMREWIKNLLHIFLTVKFIQSHRSLMIKLLGCLALTFSMNSFCMKSKTILIEAHKLDDWSRNSLSMGQNLLSNLLRSCIVPSFTVHVSKLDSL